MRGLSRTASNTVTENALGNHFSVFLLTLTSHSMFVQIKCKYWTLYSYA